MRLLLQHRTRYLYPRPALLGPHLVRLRPATHTRTKIETYSLRVDPELPIYGQQDPYGNHVARITPRAGQRVPHLDLLVELVVDIRPVNPFDFFVDPRCERTPFAYPAELALDLRPFLVRDDPALAGGPLLEALLAELPREGNTVSLAVELNSRVNRRIRYVIREEAGIWTPERTLAEGRGSCRDSAVLLVAALRSRGLAARFVSGYLVQITDEGLIPDEPKGVDRDVIDLHAWAEVFLPGAGWIGLDATSGLLCGEGHIPLACTASPALAAPVDGTSDVAASEVRFEMAVGRLGHEPRPTRPYEDAVWEALLASGEAADARLAAAGLTLTSGGEPTFNSREHPEAPEWCGDALGPTKWSQGLRLSQELLRRLAPGGVLLYRQGKWYPGESLPRWALDVVGRRDGAPIWREAGGEEGRDATAEDAQRFMEALSRRLGLRDFVLPAYEDPWRFLQDEASLPVDVDPREADLEDPEERRRLARVLDRGLGRPAGFALPIDTGRDSAFAGPSIDTGRERDAWRSERWRFRRGDLYLLQGDSPMGLRLPLQSLPFAEPPEPVEEAVWPPDPRRAQPDVEETQRRHDEEMAGAGIGAAHRRERHAAPPEGDAAIRTALCVEAREGRLFVFLPPMQTADDFLALLAEVDGARDDCGLDVLCEGYPPPSDPRLCRFSVTPDPGVLEVNLPPSAGTREHAGLMEAVFDAALHSGLHCEKYLIDGRQAGSGGGHHITLGGPTPLGSPFLKRPDILASLLTFVQHHPSLSYMFAGLFVGPTSQAPRVDEARHEALYELEIAMDRLLQRQPGEPPWLADWLLRHLLVDVTGNTHRTEVSIDKLFDHRTAHGRQGLIELRAFEMPPHYRMAVAQVILMRALIAAFAAEPYQGPLVRWGQALHDRFLLPYHLWRDFEDVLAFLTARGLPLPAEGYQPFVELRCPLAGTMQAGDVTVEVRNALEPWHVLGEELTATGTARFVDSSMERIEVRARGLVPERHLVLVNGRALPLRPTHEAGEAVAGVRFRAWAPPHSLQPHLGIHHPIRIDVLDTWGRRSIGACAYHVWHAEGRAFEEAPLTRFEASARRAQRFTREGPLPWPVDARPMTPHPDAPCTMDLRRYPMDRPMPKPEAGEAVGETVGETAGETVAESGER